MEGFRVLKVSCSIIDCISVAMYVTNTQAPPSAYYMPNFVSEEEASSLLDKARLMHCTIQY